jgi:hypothetical protein
MGSVSMPLAPPALGSPFITIPDSNNTQGGAMSPLIKHGSQAYSTQLVSGRCGHVLLVRAIQG